MPVTPDELLALAVDIFSDETAEKINHRNAAGRAYYSIYHFLKPIAEKISPIPLGSLSGGVHEVIIRTLKEHQPQQQTRERDMEIRSLGILMEMAKANRVDADYDISSNFQREDAELAIETAKRIKNKYSNL